MRKTITLGLCAALLAGCMTDEQRVDMAINQAQADCAAMGYKRDMRGAQCVWDVAQQHNERLKVKQAEQKAAAAAAVGILAGAAIGAAAASSRGPYCWRDIYGRIWC